MSHSVRHGIDRASVVGAGPNGLAAAIVLAQSGISVDVLEAQQQPGGGVRTAELTLPGFRHDVGSAVHPLAVGSPFFSSLPLETHGLRWIHSPKTVAHPLDDGTSVVLDRDLHVAERELGIDGRAWRRLVEPFASNWDRFAREVLQPVHPLIRTPWLLARLGVIALSSAIVVADRLFASDRTKALFAGMAAHSFLAMNESLSAAFGVLLATTCHAVGWPIPAGGAQSITTALCEHLSGLGGTIVTSRPIVTLDDLPAFDLALCDVTPRQLLRIAGAQFTSSYRRRLQSYRYGPGVFKVDYALSRPIPWRSPECNQAATVHVGGTMADIAASEHEMRHGQNPERPFVLLSQPTLFDPTRAPAGMHIAWAYCHVPNGSNFDMLPRLESQIERFAPGFRDCILARHVFKPSDLEQVNANLIGGDIAGGATNLPQFLFRPTWRQYATSHPRIFLCSSSTPPGAGVHGMCGYNAAHMALRRLA